MKITGVNRIAIGVPDIEQAIDHYTRLLNAKFERVPEEFCSAFGSHVAIAWDARIELVAPLPGAAGEVIGLLPKTMGLMGIVFDVEDVDAAASNAEANGVAVARQLRLDVGQINAVFGDSITRFEEISLDVETSGIPMVFAKIDRIVASS